MKKVLLLCMTFMLALTSVKAGNYDNYYQNLPVSMPKVTEAVIPDYTERISEV